MRAGTFDRLGYIQQEVVNRNGFGEDIITWTTFKRIWLSKQDLSGNERYVAAQFVAETDTLFKGHWHEGITGKMRLVVWGKSYDILAAIEIGRREGIAISARSRND